MKLFWFGCIALTLVSATPKDKKISLLDIEKDNLKNEKAVKILKQSPEPQPPQQPSSSPTQYGFVPSKTAEVYRQQQPKQEYVQAQYPGLQYPVTSKYAPPQAQYNPPQYQYQYADQNQQPEQKVKGPQDYSNNQQPVYVMYQPQVQVPQYQQYENVQYIADNSVALKGQQYYQEQPQYVYVQQYPSPSNSIQTILDPKGQLQYIMYIPSYVPAPQQTQTYETVAYANPNEAPQPEEYPQQYSEIEPEPKYSPQYEQKQEYVEEQKPIIKYPYKSEPKSLLDSYVPSILQLQYYKQQQQQAQANALRETLKLSQPVPGKVDYVKTANNPYSRLSYKQ